MMILVYCFNSRYAVTELSESSLQAETASENEKRSKQCHKPLVKYVRASVHEPAFLVLPWPVRTVVCSSSKRVRSLSLQCLILTF